MRIRVYGIYIGILKTFCLPFILMEKEAKKIDKIVRHAEVSEKAIERYLCDVVKKLGGVCLKYSNAGEIGYPDRVALMPQGRCLWFELKSLGRKPSKVQKIRFNQLECIGHHVYVVDSKPIINSIFRDLGYDL